MKLRLCFLLNRLADFDFADLVERHLPRDAFAVSIVDAFPEQPEQFGLIVPWSYRQHLPLAQEAGNVVVFHSSDLPEGRGWAPLYHTVALGKPHFTVCGILASNEIDAGDIVVRARFPLPHNITAPFLRRLDEELMVLLAARLAIRFQGRRIVGKPQQGAASHWPRRRPEDSEIDPLRTLAELLPHLRALEPAYPAYFWHEGQRYLLEVRPAETPHPPREVEIIFLENGERELWYGWDEGSKVELGSSDMGVSPT